MKQIGFLGLGKMGKGICSTLIQKGYHLHVYDLDAERMKPFRGIATLCQDADEVFEHSEATFLSLPSSLQVEPLTRRFASLGMQGKYIIDLSTSQPVSTRELARIMSSKGCHFIDAPLLGGPKQAMEGTLLTVAGGSQEDFNACLALLNDFSREVIYAGNSGSGHVVKLLMNFVGLGIAGLYAQAFTLAEKYGISTEMLNRIIETSSSNSGILAFYGPKIKNADYRLDFALELALKDFSYVKRLYEETNTPAFMLDGLLDILRTGIKDGRGKHDYSEIAAVLRDYLK